MKIKGVTLKQVERIAKRLHFEFRNARTEGRYVCGVIRMAVPLGRSGYQHAHPAALKYRKRGFQAHVRGSDAFGGNGAVCFHGHEAFMRGVFTLNPNAVIRSKGTRQPIAYLGLADFEAKFDALGDVNIGSEFNPLRYRDSCDCERS